MARRLFELPLFLMMAGVMSALMLVPAGFALSQQAFEDARAFFYSAILGIVIVTLVAVARAGRKRRTTGLAQLLALLAGFALWPLILAVPFYESVRTTSFVNAYFEMVSSLTTTGATLFDPVRLSEAEHLWRAMVGWIGGLIMWVAAAAILAPLTLGGFEVTAAAEPGQGTTAPRVAQMDGADPHKRLQRASYALVPVYVLLTGVLWVALVVAGDTPLTALCHAMSVLATSGISPVGGVEHAQSGFVGELLVFVFLLFALSRLTFSNDAVNSSRPGLRHDPEFRMGILVVLGVPALLFLRHWLAAFDVGGEENLMAALRALWGSVFTVLSFLSTAGFQSNDWEAAQTWSGLQTPGLILMGLALVGGGVATTAGGVKLLRVFALYLNGTREVERLVHPSSVARTGGFSRQIRREGAFVAWIFFMIFAMTLAVVTMGLAAMGVGFEHALVLAIAALSTTGPLITAAPETPVALAQFGTDVKLWLAAAMVLGRLEMLAIIALITPDLWRN